MYEKYPHWYYGTKMEPCCEEPERELMCEDEFAACNCKVQPYPRENFKDRLLCMLQDEVLFSVDASICGRTTFCGTLCYVGCDFIIVNISIHRRALSMHVPIKMIRFIAPHKS